MKIEYDTPTQHGYQHDGLFFLSIAILLMILYNSYPTPLGAIALLIAAVLGTIFYCFSPILAPWLDERRQKRKAAQQPSTKEAKEVIEGLVAKFPEAK